MSTFSLVLQLWITLKNALHPPKVRGIGDSIFNVSPFQIFNPWSSLICARLYSLMLVLLVRTFQVEMPSCFTP